MVGINQLLLRWRGFSQNAKPGERINAVVGLQNAAWDLAATHAVETVATDQVITRELLRNAAVRVSNQRLIGFNVMNADVGAVEPNLPVVRESACDQIFDNLLLAVYGN